MTNGNISVANIALFLIPVLAVAIFIGAGGWGFQYGDWPKHNSILRDLVTESWPVIYKVGGEQIMLTYYTAYQLPAALAGKLFGWDVANHVLFLYTVFGLALCALWIRLFTEVQWWWLFLVFVGFSGMDVLGQVISALHQQPTLTEAAAVLGDNARSFRHLEWWAGWGFAQYSSMAALLVLVPNQAIAGWLLTALILSDTRAGHLKLTALLYLGLCSLWTPFVGLGLIPLVLFMLVYEWRKNGHDMQLPGILASLPNIAGIATGLVIAVYLLGRFQEFVLPIDLGSIVYEEKVTLTFLRLPNQFFLRYLLFVLLEFALLHALLYWYLYRQKEPLFRPMLGLLIFSSVFLLLLPLLNWGWNNEPSMRSSIPALFITALITIRVLADPARSSTAIRVKRAILGILVIGGLNAAFEISREIVGVYERGELVSIPDRNEIDTIFEIQEERYRNYHNFAGQYVGSANSYFSRYLARH
ncbi:MAG TPA: hypothetical protein VET88_09635 [Gammaproteobacteria bacterium]|nr:hypothetical protein [Gammaproteobacteria bacterium]